ncbi:hypothetical protein ANME2D_02817 [Candidatus Methanoperedens nitroreducens]|uniref:Uncharacterized protein n=1 Tax=Candidatus Methanoperedens nitratireducens TaxID=1392998 RepID=A0A062V064_9EURY|nr:hypothetical protein ANME2D_02817 [Candidatus Methanoperedens nitroreducens]
MWGLSETLKIVKDMIWITQILCPGWLFNTRPNIINLYYKYQTPVSVSPDLQKNV